MSCDCGARFLGIALCLVTAAAHAPLARADGPNIEPVGFAPEGLTWGVASFGGAFLSTDCCDIGGERGAAALQLRWGTAATRRLLWLVQLDSGTVLAENSEGNLVLNQVGSITVDGQYYVRDVVWLKAGAGFSGYTIRQDDEQTSQADLERGGIAVLGGMGFDVAQNTDAWFFGAPRQDFALSFEILIIGSIYPRGRNEVDPNERLEPGGILQMSVGLGAQWY